MLRTIGKTVGGALAVLCFASTLALAQGQTMTCMRDDGKGNCTAAADSYGRTVVVFGEGAIKGTKMVFEDRGYMTNCEAIVTK